MSTLVGALVHVALFVLAFKLYFFVRRRAKDKRKEWKQQRWRRRSAIFLFCLPALLWVGERVLPEEVQPLVTGLRFLSHLLDMLLAGLVGVAESELTGIWAWIAKPILHTVVYTGFGALIGWPIDRFFNKRAAEKGEEDVDSEGSEPATEGAPAEPEASPEASPEGDASA